MSVKTCLITLSIFLLASIYGTPAKAFHPMNVRKLYDIENEERFKKNDMNFHTPIDEDVLELEKLKHQPLENSDNLEGDILPALQKQLEQQSLINDSPPSETLPSLSSSSPTPPPPSISSTINQGQPEEEEHVIIQHKPPTAPVSSTSSHQQNINHEHQSQDVQGTSAIEKMPSAPVKPYYGAARLAFGQNPEIAITTTPLPTTSKISSSTTGLPSISPVTITSTTIEILKNDDDSSSLKDIDDDKSSLSSELETTKNGERRSYNKYPPTKGILEENIEKLKDGHFSAFDMAQYVFWTGDEAGVAKAVEELIQQGLMSRENAIKFLKDIRFGIEYLQNTYSNRIYPNSIKTANDYMLPSLQTASATATQHPFTTTAIPGITIPPNKFYHHGVGEDILFDTEKPFSSIETENIILTEKLQRALEGIPTLLKLQEINNARKKENSIENDESNGRIRLADFLYAEYSLEEVIYQLAKVMFSQSLTHGSEQSQRALQKLTEFLASEGEHGRISPALQKKVLDVLLAALSDTLAEHPELLAAARASLGNSFHKLPKPSIMNQ